MFGLSAAKTRQVLKPLKRIEIVSIEHDPDTYYRNRSGLWIEYGFRSRIVANAKPTPAGTTCNVDVFELPSAMTDKEIEDALPPNHLFDESTVCALVAALIEKQKNGEDGDLLTNGYANLFYTRACVVDVRCARFYRESIVYTWDRGGLRGVCWPPGLLSRNLTRSSLCS